MSQMGKTLADLERNKVVAWLLKRPAVCKGCKGWRDEHRA